MESFQSWYAEANLSRKVTDPGDDFSDGVLVAEVIKHYIPTLVDLDTYQTTRQYEMKLINWKSLNRMVFKKLGFEANIYDLECVCQGQTTAVKEILAIIRQGVDQYLHEEQRRKLFPAAKVKRDHLNQKLESIRSTYFRQRTSHSPEKTPLKKTRGNVLVLPSSQGPVNGERDYKIPPMTAPELNGKGLGGPKTKEPTSVTFNPVTMTQTEHNITQEAGKEAQIKLLEQQLQEANENIATLTEKLDKSDQENTELKSLLQTQETNMEKLLVEIETLKEENHRKDCRVEELQAEVAQMQQ